MKLYPIIFDFEVRNIGNNAEYLFGFYLTEDQICLYIYWKQSGDILYINTIRKYVLVQAMQWDQTQSKKGCILVGYNILDFDVIILANFLYAPQTNLSYISDAIIKKELGFKERNLRLSISENVAILDTLAAQEKGDSDRLSLFVFKIDFFLNKKSKLVPKEYCFEWQETTLHTFCLYNFNDLYFTWLLFFHNAKCASFVQSTYQRQEFFYKEKPERYVVPGIPKMLSGNTRVMQADFIGAASGSYLPEKEFKGDFLGTRVIYLHNYRFLDLHKKNMTLHPKNLIIEKYSTKYYKKEETCHPYHICGQTIMPSLGGLHTKPRKVLKNQGLVYNKKPFFGDKDIVCFWENEIYTAVKLDFQSYYPNIVIQLAMKMKLLPDLKSDDVIRLASYVEKLTQMRLELKKKGDPMDATVELLILTVTGNFNNEYSVVHNPDFYYSMTANGQLLMLQLLCELEPLIEHVLLINTDGVFFVMKKENKTKVWDVCDHFQTKYNYVIDTRKEIRSAIIFGSNRYTLIYKEEKSKQKKEVEVRGFKKKLGFSFMQKVFLHWQKEAKDEPVFFTAETFYNSLFKAFLNVYTNEFLLYDWLDCEKNKKGKFLYYLCCSNPTHVSGYYIKHGEGVRNMRARYALKMFYFQENQIDLNLIKNNIDVASYWDLLRNTLDGAYVCFLTKELTEQKKHGIRMDIKEVYRPQTLEQYLKKTYFAKCIVAGLKLGLYPMLKDQQKKSFNRTEYNQATVKKDIKNNEKEAKADYLTYVIKNNTTTFLKTCALFIPLKQTWSNAKILCLDCDNIELFFKVNQNNVEILNFIVNAKLQNSLIWSSPTNTPFDRFKILVSVQSKLNYKAIQEKFKKGNLGRIFSLEVSASIYGENTRGVQLKSSSKLNPLAITEEVLFKLPCDPQKIENIEGLAFFEQKLCSFFEERNSIERLQYNRLNADEKKSFKYVEEEINKELFESVFDGVINKKNKNKLKTVNFRTFYQFFYTKELNQRQILVENNTRERKTSYTTKVQLLTPSQYQRSKPFRVGPIQVQQAKPYKISTPINQKEKTQDESIENKQNTKKKQEKTTKSTPKNLDIEKSYKKENIDILVDLKKQKVLKLDLSNPKILALYELLFEHLNQIFDTQFEFTEECQDDEGNPMFLFHSLCIFDADPYNSKQVTVYIDHMGYASINCYHRKCTEFFKYSEILSIINKHVYAYWEDLTSSIFVYKVEKIEDIFEI